MAGGALAACILVKGSDGAACSKGSECKSEGCSNGTCSGSQCKCDGGDCPATGAPSPNCEEGWECAHWSSSGDPIFHSGSGAGNSCQPLCGHCPLHYKCDTPNQKFCTYDSYWASPMVTIEGPTTVSVGQTVTYHGHATSPVHAGIVRWEWHAGYDGFQNDARADITYTFTSAGTSSVRVIAFDDTHVNPGGTAEISVTVR